MTLNTAIFRLTRLIKEGGALTKHVTLAADGSLKSDGSACIMSRGVAQRIHIDGIHQLAALIGDLRSNEAITLGALRPGLPDQVEITTKRGMEAMNGAPQPGIIARTGSFFVYQTGQPAFVLLDFDTKGMPLAVAAGLNDIGGFWPALETVLPEMAAVARLRRRSTSAGLFRADTGERLLGSDGQHVYIPVYDGADAERFLKTLHARCWLSGLGWMMVGAGGQLLERSIVDRMVGAPERLVFEGAPLLDPPLAQDQECRRPLVKDGTILDTVAACPPLTILEQSKLRRLRACEAQRLGSDSIKAREAFITDQAKNLADRAGLTRERAAHLVSRQCAGMLLPHVALMFDDKELDGATVADVLADPARYEDATLADPLEGIEYGTCKAKIMRRGDGTPWIHSFAHGRTVYDLRYDAAAVNAALSQAPADERASLFVRLALTADLDQEETERLRNLAAKRAGIGVKTMAAMLKRAQQQRKAREAEEAQQRRTAERRDPRPQVPAPVPDAPWLPQMDVLNDVLGASSAAEPPMRDIEGAFTQVRVRPIVNMHTLTACGVNEGDTEESRLPAPEQPLLTRLNEVQLAELIERHIDYTDPTGRSIHLASPFVRHYLQRDDDALPVVGAIATLPLVLPNGKILSARGLVRERGIVFRIPEELSAHLPAHHECNDDAVTDALAFLMDTWLCDVATDDVGKCILIAAALTLIERSLLPDRPVFFVTAGRRGGGKTTALIMLLMAITGVRPAAAAWSPNEEERRKALLAYLLEALPAIIWDNIPRGAQISCPHIERSCTTAFYSDRRLGVTELVAVAAAVVHLFTGNNIGPRGDLASRALITRLELDRPDPENRPFVHPDPIGWTEANRGKILRAFYTILLGNPRLRARTNDAPKTRFKSWWHLVGAAIEHAVSLSGRSLDFQALFLSQEEDEEDSASLTDALAALHEEWSGGETFTAADVAKLLNDQSAYRTDDECQRSATVRDFLFPAAPPAQIVTPKAVGRRLKRHVGEPIKHGDRTLILRASRDPYGRVRDALQYCLQVT